jgi:hypothetical protein
MSDSNSGTRFQKLSRRKFLAGSAAAATGAVVVAQAERAEAFFNMGAFWKKPNTSSGQTSNGYTIGQSLRLNYSSGANLTRTVTVSDTNLKQWIWSGWIKVTQVSFNTDGAIILGSGGGGTGAYATTIGLTPSYQLSVYASLPAPTVHIQVTTSRVFRDPSAWYHIVVAVDTTQATYSNGVRIWVNGVQETSFASTTYTQNVNTYMGAADGARPMRVGSHTIWSSGAYYDQFDGYIAETTLLMGATNANPHLLFGQIDINSGQWIPKAYTGGSFGTNGFYLPFSSNSAVSGSGTHSGTFPSITGVSGIGADFSGNDNHFTANNIQTYDQVLDSPTNNFCTLNPNDHALSGNSIGQNGNLKYYATSVASYDNIRSSHGISSGKWYFEFYYNSSGGSPYNLLGFASVVETLKNTIPPYDGYFIDISGLKANHIQPGPTGYSAYGSAYTPGNSVLGQGMCAIDLDNGKVWFGQGGSWFSSGSPATGASPAFTGITGTYAPHVSAGYSCNIDLNFGQGGQTGLTYDAASGGRFKYTPPTGFKALCTANLPTPTIKNGSQNFNAVTYTGSGANKSIAVGFQPDFVWTKCRNQNAYHHVINDSVRGAGKDLFSDITDAEGAARTDCLTSWTSNGYSLGADAGTALWNWNNNTYVAWCWRAGTVKTSGWSGGTITPTKESYNPTAGLSIISYTGTGTAGTLPHSLGAAPAFIVQKSRADASASWIMYHQAMGASNYILFDTSAAATSAVMWNSTTPTTSVFSVGNHIYSNNSGSNYIVYLWAEVAGFSKFGSYTGNGSSDGPFVYCGFKPAYILIKRIDAAGYNWEIHDNKRDSYNQAENFLYANLANSEATSSDQKLDILSNGFKLRNIGATINGGGTYIFAAFAEAPFKYANAR